MGSGIGAVLIQGSQQADTEYGNGEGAEAACSGARSRGAALTQLGRGGGTTRAGVQQDVASGAAGGFIGRQPVTLAIKIKKNGRISTGEWPLLSIGSHA